jgi:hypothetical protein
MLDRRNFRDLSHCEPPQSGVFFENNVRRGVADELVVAGGALAPRAVTTAIGGLDGS